MAADDSATVEQDGREIDLLAYSYCEECGTNASVDETDVGEESGWKTGVCDCGDMIVKARVAPWPRDEMVRVGDEWQYETGNEWKDPVGERGDADGI